MTEKSNEILVNGEKYTYIRDIHEDERVREKYFQLAKEIFCLNFEKWYQSGYCRDLGERVEISGTAVTHLIGEIIS